MWSWRIIKFIFIWMQMVLRYSSETAETPTVKRNLSTVLKVSAGDTAFNRIEKLIVTYIIIGYFPAKFANLTIKCAILTSFKFAKWSVDGTWKFTIHIHSLIIQFNIFSQRYLYVVRHSMLKSASIRALQIRDRTSRRLNWMTRLRKSVKFSWFGMNFFLL